MNIPTSVALLAFALVCSIQVIGSWLSACTLVATLSPALFDLCCALGLLVFTVYALLIAYLIRGLFPGFQGLRATW